MLEERDQTLSLPLLWGKIVGRGQYRASSCLSPLSLCRKLDTYTVNVPNLSVFLPRQVN